jgi:hypothetical protein
MNLVDNPDRRDQFRPLSAANSGWIVVTQHDRDGAHLAVSVDGVTWQTSAPPETFVKGWANQLATVSDRFVALVSDKEQGSNSSIQWSENGLLWREPSDRPAGTFDLFLLAAGRSAVVVQAAGLSAGASSGWWISGDGSHWIVDHSFGPLGAANDHSAIGLVAGDGDRIVGYQFDGAKVWTSFDATDWSEIPSAGELPPSKPIADALTVLPIGLLYRDFQGGAWFGDPHAEAGGG